MSKKSLMNNRRSSVRALKIRQAFPLGFKEQHAWMVISQFCIFADGKVYVSFSGGKDSTVLVHLVRRFFPDIEIVFVNTGLELDSIIKFVRTFDNCTIITPKMRFPEVIQKHGYPIASKKISMGISRYVNTNSEEQKSLRINGGINPTSGKSQQRSIPVKFKFLIDAPFKSSEKCCDIMKKNPAKQFFRDTGKMPFIGTMAEESDNRKASWVINGCNMYDVAIPKSTPLSIWTEKDIWDYIKYYKLPYADVYDKGATRTGCYACTFGHWIKNDEKDRFELLKELEPKKYEYCMKDVVDGGLGLRKVIDYVDRGLRHGQLSWDF